MTTVAPWTHIHMKAMSRSSGRSAVQCAAYRAGARYMDERYATVRDFTRKKDVVNSFTFAPENAPGWAQDGEQLWNAVEAKENRINSQVAFEWEVALPAELDDVARLGIARKFTGWLVEEYGVAGTCGIHSGEGRGNDLNDHMHVMMTTREIDADGFGKKLREFNTRPGTKNPEVDRVRHKAADIINEALEDAGSDERVDHRSFRERGIDKEPTRHLGPAAAAMERKAALANDFGSERGDWNRAIIEERIAEQEVYARALARAYDPESAPAELSLDTERELARRFGEEWRAQPKDIRESVAAAPREIDGEEWTKAPGGQGVEGAMQGDIARLEATGTTDANHGLLSLLRRGAATFRELLADERGKVARELSAPEAEPPQAGPQTWVARVFAEVKERGARAASRWFRTGPDEPDIFRQDLAAHIAAGPKAGGDFPISDDGGGGGGERLLRPVEPDEPQQQRPHEAAQPAAPVAAGFDAAWKGPDWMNDIIAEELPDAADLPSADPPAPEPEPDNGPDMDIG